MALMNLLDHTSRSRVPLVQEGCLRRHQVTVPVPRMRILQLLPTFPNLRMAVQLRHSELRPMRLPRGTSAVADLHLQRTHPTLRRSISRRRVTHLRARGTRQLRLRSHLLRLDIALSRHHSAPPRQDTHQPALRLAPRLLVVSLLFPVVFSNAHSFYRFTQCVLPLFSK